MAPKLAEGEATKKGGAKKASKTAKAVKQSISRKQSKMRINIHFFRPKTLTKKRDPKYPNKSVEHVAKMDKYRTTICPVTTESAMKKIEEINTLVFLVDIQASKLKIKEDEVQCT